MDASDHNGHAAASSGSRLSASRASLQHKTSGYSTADTFASAVSQEGYYTDNADTTRNSTSRFDSVPDTINATVEDEATRRGTSQDTAPRQHSLRPVANRDAPAEEVSSSATPSFHQETAASPEVNEAKREEAGEQIEPVQPMGTVSVQRRLARHVATVSLLSFAAIWGVLARLGLSALNTYDGQSVTPLVWSQAVGCLIMGLATGGTNQNALESKYPPIYIMITTGFCGSVTTFSAWILSVFRAFGDQEHFNRGGLHNVMDALTQTGVTIGMSIVSLVAGRALANVISIDKAIKLGSGKTREDKSLHYQSAQQPRSTLALDSSVIVFGFVFWAGAAILCGLYAPFRNVSFSLVMAPPGAVLRWYLSRLNSRSFSKRYSIPLGTLAANLLATAVIAGAFTSSRVGSVPNSFYGGLTGCQALTGLQDGFCGCLSTISTFAVELRDLKPARKAVRYALISWVAGILLCVLLMGAPWWALGMDGRCLNQTA